MNFYKANWATIILRFYLMMFLVVGSFFIGLPYLAILAVPVFLSAMMGINYTSISFKKKHTEERLNKKLQLAKNAA